MEIDVQLEDVQVFGRCMRVGVVIGEDSGAEKGVLQDLCNVVNCVPRTVEQSIYLLVLVQVGKVLANFCLALVPWQVIEVRASRGGVSKALK